MKIQVQKTATFTGHADGVYAIEPAADPDSFFSAGGDGLVVLWNLQEPEAGQLIARIPASVYALHFLETENELLVGQNQDGLHCIDLHQRQQTRSLKLPETAIFALKSHHNHLFAALGNGALYVIDKRDFTILKILRFSDKSLRCLALNPATNELAAGYSDCHIRIFDLHTLALKHTWQAHGNSVFTLAYSPDGQLLVSGSRDARLKAWNLPDYSLHTSVNAHLFAINHLSFSPSGKYLVTGSMDKAVKIWDAATLQLLKVIDKARLAGHGTSINATLWLPNGTILTASDDRTLSAWQVFSPPPTPP